MKLKSIISIFTALLIACSTSYAGTYVTLYGIVKGTVPGGLVYFKANTATVGNLYITFNDETRCGNLNHSPDMQLPLAAFKTNMPVQKTTWFNYGNKLYNYDSGTCTGKSVKIPSGTVLGQLYTYSNGALSPSLSCKTDGDITISGQSYSLHMTTDYAASSCKIVP